MISTAGLFPNRILSAYGIDELQAGGLQGQGVRIAILGEAPTPVNDVTAFRSCFGFDGTGLQIHGGSRNRARNRRTPARSAGATRALETSPVEVSTQSVVICARC